MQVWNYGLCITRLIAAVHCELRSIREMQTSTPEVGSFSWGLFGCNVASRYCEGNERTSHTARVSSPALFWPYHEVFRGSPQPRSPFLVFLL